MDRYQVALLDLSTPGGVVMHRWHGRHGWGDVTWEEQTWSFAPFEHGGISAGAVLEASTCELTLPRLSSLEAILRAAHRDQWRGRLRVIQWSEAADDGANIPDPEDAFVMATFRGVLSLGALTLTGITASLDSSLLAGRGGGQFPPRVATTLLIGTPVVLEGRR